MSRTTQLGLISTAIMFLPALMVLSVSRDEIDSSYEIISFFDFILLFVAAYIVILFESNVIDWLGYLGNYNDDLATGAGITLIAGIVIMWLTMCFIPLTYRKQKHYPIPIFLIQAAFSIGNATVGYLLINNIISLSL